MTEAATIQIDEKLFGEFTTILGRVAEARARYNSSREDAKSKKHALDHAVETFESISKRLVTNTNGSDLPLFNQSELLERAEADPVVMRLTTRLLGYGLDVNAIIVAGYTQDERHAADAWLDAMDAHHAAADAGEEAGDAPEPPAFLQSQPLTPIEVADLIARLSDAGHAFGNEVRDWTRAQTAEVMAWLTETEAIKAAKGEAVTFDDLPAPPAFFSQAEPKAEAQDSSAEPGGHGTAGGNVWARSPVAE